MRPTSVTGGRRRARHAEPVFASKGAPDAVAGSRSYVRRAAVLLFSQASCTAGC